MTLLVIDTAANTPKTGDAANLTAYVSKDDGSVTVLGDTSATELDATNAPGLYTFDLTQGETNADKLLFSGKSSTSGIKVVPLLVYTRPPSFSSITIANGCVDADVERFGGTAATMASGIPEVKVASIAANAVNASALATDAVSEIIAGSPTLADVADAVWNALVASYTTVGSFGDKFRMGLTAGPLKALCTSGSSTTAVVLNATTGIEGGVPSAVNDHYNGRTIIFITGTLAKQAATITDYVGSTQTLTVTALTSAPSSGDIAVIV